MNLRHILICWLISAFFAAALPLPSHAQMVFERTKIRIDPAPLIPTENGQDDTAALPPRDPVTYSIELRPEDAMRLEYIHTLNSLTPDTGVMIHFTSPVMAPLPNMNVFTPVDALFVADDGVILQILPNVVLGEMNQTIQAKSPVKAFLFLKAGQAAARAIRPRDIVVGSTFTPPPPIQE